MQTQEVDLAYAEKTWVVRPVWRVATGAAFGLHGYVFIDKRSPLVGVTLRANCISAGEGSDLSQGGCPVNVVAVAALHEPFIHAMVIGFGEVRLR